MDPFSLHVLLDLDGLTSDGFLTLFFLPISQLSDQNLMVHLHCHPVNHFGDRERDLFVGFHAADPLSQVVLDTLGRSWV